MNLIGVLSSDPNINKLIAVEFETKIEGQYDLRFPGTREDILEFFNFELPEIVIINFTDPNIDMTEIVTHLKSDAWLHNFGILGLFEQAKASEEDVLEDLGDVNVLAMLNHSRISSHIVKSVQIIDQNRQIIFQRELSDKLFDRALGSFIIDNDPLAVSIYAGIAATTLAQRGFILPEKKMHLQLALSELLINAIEHGNCDITFDEKTDFLEKGLSVVELVSEKCKQPETAARRVFFEWEIHADSTRFFIRDEGTGFDVLGLNEKLNQEGDLSLHGRGIRMARALAEKLYYNEVGNEVTLIYAHDSSVHKETPRGFTGEEVLYVNKGDIIMREGESSDFLYYISSGRYSVFHRNKHIGMLHPTDIFMGEMSFLLNNRRSATIRAEQSGKLIKISRKSFVSVVKEYPHYGIFLSKLIARKLVRANIRNVQLQGKQTPKAASV